MGWGRGHESQLRRLSGGNWRGGIARCSTPSTPTRRRADRRLLSHSSGIVADQEFEDESDPTATFFHADYELRTWRNAAGRPAASALRCRADRHGRGHLADHIGRRCRLQHRRPSRLFAAPRNFADRRRHGRLRRHDQRSAGDLRCRLGPANRTSTSPLTLNTGVMDGQIEHFAAHTSTRIGSAEHPRSYVSPANTRCPSATTSRRFFARMATRCARRRSSSCELGSGGQGICAACPMTLDDPAQFLSRAALHVRLREHLRPSAGAVDENPLYPTLRLGSSGQPAGTVCQRQCAATKDSTLNNTPFLVRYRGRCVGRLGA